MSRETRSEVAIATIRSRRKSVEAGEVLCKMLREHLEIESKEDLIRLQKRYNL